VHIISAKDLSMTYRVPVRGEGLEASLRALIRPEFRRVEAVRQISFEIGEGEVVGFIGPNGAGKTTTLKILSGILHPTGGRATVLGHTPGQREGDFLRQIAMIRGSRPISAPIEITVLDALRFQQAIYRVPEDRFRMNLAELAELLNLGPLLDRQIRALSLGERMRAGLAWSLLYRPRVLFLDEPTLGLDVVAVTMMRRFVADYAAATGATIMLTSHYMADVEQLCPRIILIDRGQLAYDGSLSGLAQRLTPYKLVKVSTDIDHRGDWERLGEVVSCEAGRTVLRVPREDVREIVASLLADEGVSDLGVEEPPLEMVISQAYQEGVGA